MIHKDLCKAQNTKYWTPLKMQLNFLLSSVHTWNGVIPLTIHEIAEELKCRPETVKRLLIEAETEGIVHWEADRLFFDKYIRYSEKTQYVKHFAFLQSEEFRNEDVQVIRFVLEMLNRGIYNDHSIFNMKFSNLFHKRNRLKEIVQDGLFNVYHGSKMKEILIKAEKYLIFSKDTSDNIIRVIGIQPKYANLGIIENQGEKLLVLMKLKDLGLEDVNTEKIEELIKVKSRYLKLDPEMAQEIGSEALRRSLESDRFKSLLLMSDNHREIGAYFSHVCQEVENEYAQGLFKKQESLKRAKNFTKTISGSLSGIKQNLKQLYNEILKPSIERVKEQINAFDRYWSTIIVDKALDPDKRDKALIPIIENPLSSQLETFQRMLASVREQTSKSIEEIPFTFYNWLEES